jgi:hypothetical protein
MREDLASMGHSPSEDDFYAIVIGSLPPSYDPYVSALNATSSVLGTFLSPDDLMQTITDEYERRNLGRTTKREENVAFAAEDDGHRGRSVLTCFNCGKKGHKKADCWGEGGGKAGQAPWEKGKGGNDEKSEGKGKEDKVKGKEIAASVQEYDAAWMVMLDEPNSEDRCFPSPSTYPSLDELLEGFTANAPDSDDEDDEGDLDEWEDDSEEMESECVNEVAGERMPLEGKIEDLDVPEVLQASVSPVPTENDEQQAPTPIPEPIFKEEDTEGVLLLVPPVAEDVQRTQRENAITTPQDWQMPQEEAEEDQVMAIWLSDPEDDEDVGKEDQPTATTMKEVGTQKGNEPVEGERGDFDKQVDNEGNQPIPLATEPKDGDWPIVPQVEENTRNEKLPLVQPEEQREWWGTTASGENAGAAGSDEGVDEANEAIRPPTTVTNMAEDPEGRRKVNPSTEDDAKSNPCTPIHAQPKFDGTEIVSTPMDHENTLSEGQHLPSPAKIIKMKNIPFREGFGPPMHTPKSIPTFSIAIDTSLPKFREEPPHFSSDKSRGRGGASWVNPRKHGGGATHLKASVHDFRDLEGGRDMSLVRGKEKDLLPDPGGVPQHRLVGCMPRADEKSSLDQSKGAHNAMWKAEAEAEEEVARIHAADARRPVLGNVPTTRNRQTAVRRYQRHVTT